MNISTPVKDRQRARSAQALRKLLADTYALYTKTHDFQWNVTGPMFQTLHLLFDAQCGELGLAGIAAMGVALALGAVPLAFVPVGRSA